MITIRVNKAAINGALLIQQLEALGPVNNNFSTRAPYPGWVDLKLHDNAPQAQQDIAVQLVSDHDHTQETSGQQVINTVKSLAQSAVGVNITALTDNQRWALLGVLLWKVGAITDAAEIAALGSWVKG